MTLSRRHLLLGGAALGGAALTGCGETFDRVIGLGKRVAEIQQRHGGRIGLGARLAPGSNFNIQSDQRFAMCSTFKWVQAAAVLQAVDQGRLRLDQPVSFGPGDVLDHAPVVKAATQGRLTLAELCAAAVTVSDNSAANLLYPLIGGPAGLTTWVRGLGDTVTRFDRLEPELNSNIDKDERDTTTPDAMTGLLHTVFTGSVLKPESLDKLKAWMVASTTGKDRIRAGAPAGAVVADKTGTGLNGACNDVAAIWLPKAEGGTDPDPVFLSIYTTGGSLDTAGRNQVIADLTRVVFDTISFAEDMARQEAASSS